jgi:hypothetical protein
MLFGRGEISLWDFKPFCPCPKHVGFKIVGFGVGGEELMRRRKGGGDGEYVARVVGCA